MKQAELERHMSNLQKRVEALAEFFQQQGKPLDGGWVALQLRALLAPREDAPGLLQRAVDLLQYTHGAEDAFYALSEFLKGNPALAARPMEAHRPALVSAAWDMLHAVEAADAAGELAENIGGELIDALRAELIQPAIETSARDEEGGWYDTTVRPMEGERHP